MNAIENSRQLAEKGLPDKGFDLLRPCLFELSQKAQILAAMAYCKVMAGEYASAEYLCGEAIALQPVDKNLHQLAHEISVAQQERFSKLKSLRPSFLGLIAGLILLLCSLACILGTIPGLLSDCFEMYTRMNALESPLIYQFGGGIGLLLGIALFVRYFFTRLQCRLEINSLRHESFNPKKHRKCWGCGMQHSKRLNTCSFCGLSQYRPRFSFHSQLPLPVAIDTESPPPVQKPVPNFSKGAAQHSTLPPIPSARSMDSFAEVPAESTTSGALPKPIMPTPAAHMKTGVMDSSNDVITDSRPPFPPIPH